MEKQNPRVVAKARKWQIESQLPLLMYNQCVQSQRYISHDTQIT